MPLADAEIIGICVLLFIAGLDTVTSSFSFHFRHLAEHPDAAAMLQYTSGTTGQPKGVLLRHRSLVNVARLTLGTAEAERGSVAVNPLPMFHTAACVIGTAVTQANEGLGRIVRGARQGA